MGYVERKSTKFSLEITVSYVIIALPKHGYEVVKEMVVQQRQSKLQVWIVDCVQLCKCEVSLLAPFPIVILESMKW